MFAKFGNNSKLKVTADFILFLSEIYKLFFPVCSDFVQRYGLNTPHDGYNFNISNSSPSNYLVCKHTTV